MGIRLDFFVSELPATLTAPPRLTLIIGTLLIQCEDALTFWTIFFSSLLRPSVLGVELEGIIEKGEFSHIKI